MNTATYFQTVSAAAVAFFKSLAGQSTTVTTLQTQLAAAEATITEGVTAMEAINASLPTASQTPPPTAP